MVANGVGQIITFCFTNNNLKRLGLAVIKTKYKTTKQKNSPFIFRGLIYVQIKIKHNKYDTKQTH